jgi:hypothetical protein
VAFAIANRQSRLGSIRTVLRKDDASLLNIYKLSAGFGPEIQNKCRTMIEDFLISSIDYKLVDYEKSLAKFYGLFDLFLAIEPKKKLQENIHDNIISELKESTNNKKELAHWLNEEMLGFEWGSILILGLVILISLFVINNNSIISIVTTILLASSLSLLLLILKEMDNLTWKEDFWIWGPLTQLFIELDLIPYIPKDVIKSRGYELKKGLTYRVVDCPNPYPDFSDKKIEIVKT